MTDFDIVALTAPAALVHRVIEPLLDEYVRWVVDEMATRGVEFDDHAAVVERHQHAFRAKLPDLLGPRGRLLVAYTGGDAVGLCALEPIDATVAEIKRTYVRPAARRAGIARTMLEQLLTDATALGYRTARLETARFMTEANNLYLTLGFTDIPIFDTAEARLSGFEPQVRFMQRHLLDDR
ncbi:GNAT family N-acetyltransferase [Nocardia huaxiensis]|uniref:GNAT family N-acetyltransferase n=1 Tax=Nocardia huaxiensis TaxID=2755382 RepID=A0A7D6ZUG5_9NOCA|nr:GNAT family N-acetyltransferase [Nocardia huaxiensis]QLY28969.1 GNAT family N-acetyltransferase [Nocardia huaxiensis]